MNRLEHARYLTTISEDGEWVGPRGLVPEAAVVADLVAVAEAANDLLRHHGLTRSRDEWDARYRLAKALGPLLREVPS